MRTFSWRIKLNLRVEPGIWGRDWSFITYNVRAVDSEQASRIAFEMALKMRGVIVVSTQNIISEEYELWYMVHIIEAEKSLQGEKSGL